MFGSIINQYGNESELTFKTDIAVPAPKPNQVLIEVMASSVNPIDLMKREGYGRTIFEKQRKKFISLDIRIRFFWKNCRYWNKSY